VKKNEKLQKIFFFLFLMPALTKWSPKVYAMKKIFNQCLLGLKQPKMVKNAIFTTLLSHFFGF
jgi:hypothetical protein